MAGSAGEAEQILVGRRSRGRSTMTASKFMWIVLAGHGHNSEQLGHGFTEDLHEAKARSTRPSDGLVDSGGLTGPPRYWTWIGRR
jgi:hypothetical protein